MKILRIDPGQTPKETEISGTLESMQSMVGGLIQVIYPFEAAVALVCGDEAKLQGLPLNRALRDDAEHICDVIAGTFFLCGAPWDSDIFESLSEEQLKQYSERFRHPEIFIRLGKEILCLPAD